MDTTDTLSEPRDLEAAAGPSRRGFLRIAALSRMVTALVVQP